MIEMFRIILVSLVAGWLSWFLGMTVLRGIRTGAIHHTDSTKVCRREKNPVGFWSLVALFSGMVIMFISAWGFVVIDALNKLK
jgi:hypothetical protein